MERRSCINHPDKFCYICGKVTFADQKKKINKFIKRLYNAYFGIILGDQEKSFAPHICCTTCSRNLYQWSQFKLNKMPFGIPMIWREGIDHSTDCYFCMTDLRGWYNIYIYNIVLVRVVNIL